ncbi:MCE family protein [Pseudonocardia acaciae]|uniref:MCE family protein n=1 Tax=Pseudonocardia acaciae TaxID=551276 RepID=UPI0006862551|nr:MCE family protein [Pseudonocardia acaciae]
MPYVVDVTGRGPSTGALARRGLVAFGVLAVVVVLLLMQYRGVFRGSFPATALVADVGDGVRAGADVKLRGVLVGIVGDVRVRPSARRGLPSHELELELRPELAAGIPAGVTARVVPTNIFGAPSVELLDPRAPGNAPLARGAVILGDESEQTVQLQTVLNRLDKVLRAVHPAQLNAALTNIADALRGRGQRIGSIIDRLDPYLTTLNGHTDDFTADVRLLGTGLQGLADAAPALLDTVDNAVVTTRTIVEKRDRLAATLAGVETTADGVNGILSDNSDRIIRVVRDGAGIAGTLAPQRAVIPRSLASLGQGATALSAGLNRQAGGALSLEFSLTPFAPYTAADCPRYPGLNGPNCKGAGGTVGPVGGPEEARTIGAMLGDRPVGAAGVLLLGPIARGTTVVTPS